MDVKGYARAFLASAYLGWQVEANWTKISLYLLYAVIRPLGLSALLFFLFKAVLNDPSGAHKFLEVYVASAFFSIISAITGGESWALVSDREEYRTLGTVSIAPLGMKKYLVGRSIPFALVGILSTFAALALGYFAFGLNLLNFNPVQFVIAILFGFVIGSILALLFASTMLVTARHGLFLAEGAAGILLLFSGIVFPLEILPGWGQSFALALPTTYFVEFAKRAFGPTFLSPMLSELSKGELWTNLIVSTLVWGLATYISLVGFLRLAIKKGKLDQSTHY